MNDIIIIESSTFAAELQPAAYMIKASILENSAIIKAVENDFAQQIAVDSLKEIKAVTKSVEAARKSAKQPSLDFGKKIDCMAKEFCEELESEYARISKLASTYEEQKRKALEEAERLRQIEIRKLEDARLALEAAQLKEKQKAIQDAINAKSEKEKAEADIKLREMADKAKVEREALEAKQKDLAAPKANKIEGSRTQDRYVFKVVDIHRLYAHDRNLVRIEENTSEINKLIASGVRELPGLLIEREIKVGA